MASDIVERLRARTVVVDSMLYDCGDEAAEAITALRSRVAKLEADVRRWRELRAGNLRLLWLIAKANGGKYSFDPAKGEQPPEDLEVLTYHGTDGLFTIKASRRPLDGDSNA
jgi:hypothetical protein